MFDIASLYQFHQHIVDLLETLGRLKVAEFLAHEVVAEC